MIVPVILSGGSGTRLWPLSRKMFPKQFHELSGEGSMLRQTAVRLRAIGDFEKPMVLCNTEHRFMVAEQLREAGIQHGGIYLEPVARNTAAAVAIAALATVEKYQDPVLFVAPSDHVIELEQVLADAVLDAELAAANGYLVTFGIVPQRPETGYGYILPKPEPLFNGGSKGDKNFVSRVRAVDRFVEKPDVETAKQYVASGTYLWNSGMFMLPAARYLQELENLEPELLQHCRDALSGAEQDLDFVRLQEESFGACKSISIDHAVMEKSDQVAVVALDAGWSDVGSWASLWEMAPKDENNNLLKGDVIALGVRNSVIYSQGRLVAGVGLDDHVIIETSDAVLVAHKSAAQDIGNVVKLLEQQQREESQLHRKVFRPWGSYESVDSDDGFKVKRLIINPGAKISLQKHSRRSEHWVVVRGTARVTCGEKIFTLKKDESTYIPVGSIHQLENPEADPLEVVEVQTGDYLEEDDIVRLADQYGRV